MSRREQFNIVLVVIGAGLLWGSTLTNFSSQLGLRGDSLSSGDGYRLLSAVLYVVMFLVFLRLFRGESRVFTDVRCALAMIALFVVGSFAGPLATMVPDFASAAVMVAGLVALQLARSYFNFAVFYYLVRVRSDIRFVCVASSAILSLFVLSVASCLPHSGLVQANTLLALLAGVAITLWVVISPRVKEPSYEIDLNAPHSLPMLRWAYLPYGVCTAALPSVQYFVAQPCVPQPVVVAMLSACVLALLVCGISRDRALFAACLAVLAIGLFFAWSVLGLGFASLVSCGYLFTYLGTCILFSYGIPSMGERWHTDPMAIVVMGYALGWLLGMAIERAPLPDISDILMAKSLSLAFFGVAVPVFALISDHMRSKPAVGQTTVRASGGELWEIPCAQMTRQGIAWEEPALSDSSDLRTDPTGIAVTGSRSTADLCERAARAHGLTKREAQVLGYILQGFSEQYVADALVVSKTTIHTHVRHIYTKMDVHSHDELAHACYVGSESA